MIPQAEDTPFDAFEKHRKTYGNIVGLFIGTQPTILISGMEGVKEILGKEEFSYRPNIAFPQHKVFNYISHGNLSL
jgi:Cytochrome P450